MGEYTVGAEYVGNDTWRCPICQHEFRYGHQCEHCYWDSQVYVSPLVKRKYAVKYTADSDNSTTQDSH